MIEVKNLNKSFNVTKRSSGLLSAIKAFFKPEYSTVKALTDISFRIQPGEIVGYIGPNGAGKSTTIKIMSGILYPDSGKCQIMGLTPWESRIDHVKNIGVVFGQRSQLWWDVPVIDSFYLLKDIYKLDDKSFQSTLKLLTETLDLKDIVNVPVRQLSLGQRMRCEIAASLLHNPKILFLDEPTIGLDAVSKIAVRNFIKTINKEKNTTIILTTHDMSDIEALTDRILLIGKGKLLLDATLNELKDKYITHKKIIIDHYESDKEVNIIGTTLLERTKERTILNVDLSQNIVSEVIIKAAQLFDIQDITVVDQSVDEIIVELYRDYAI